jgi:branched-chain amino acid transport system permease protein
MSVSQWLQLLVSGITAGAIYGLVGLGYVTIYRTSRVVNFAQGSFVMMGALIAYSFLTEWGRLPFWAAGILATVAIVAISVIAYRLLVAPIMKVSLVSMILITIGLSLLFENISLIKWGGYGVALPYFTGSRPLRVFHVAISPQSLWVLGVTVVVLVVLYVLGNRTRVGKQMTATAADPVAADLCGIRTGRMVMLAFGISAAIGALGGMCISSITPTSYLTGNMLGISGFIAAIVGGWGSSSGAVVGGFTIGIAEALAGGLVPSGYASAISFLLLIVILYFRPAGILGTGLAEGEL